MNELTCPSENKARSVELILFSLKMIFFKFTVEEELSNYINTMFRNPKKDIFLKIRFLNRIIPEIWINGLVIGVGFSIEFI
jgi:hypothetical protein